MQLIKITSIPIEYQIKVERARLEKKSGASAEMNLQTKPAALDIKTQDVQIRIDTTEMRSSLGLESAPTKIKKAADKGYQAALKATAEYARRGDRLAKLNTGVTIPQLEKEKMLQQPTSETVFLPTHGTRISWIPNGIDVNYKPGECNIDWKLHQNVMDYVPGKFQMDILQYPKIEIEYLGEPNYVPPSASPNYQEG